MVLNPNSIASILMLIKLCNFVERNENKLNHKLKKQAKDFALKMQKINQYMGYIAWSEVYIASTSKKALGI